MSKFLTPPVWYDKNGEENQSLVNAANGGVSGPTNIAFGLDAKSGTDNDSHSCIAIGYQATATGRNAIAIGSYDSDAHPVGLDAGTRATGSGTIVIGGGASATGGGIAIGDGASAAANQIQLGNNNIAYTLNIGNGYASIGNFKITPIKSGDYANQVILGNVNQIKAPVSGISFEVGERRGIGTIIYPTKIKTNMVESYGYSVSAISKSSTNGSLKLDPNCLYLIICGSKRAMLHTTRNNSNTYQFIYSLSNTQDLVMYVNNVLSDTDRVTCKLQTYTKGGSYTDVTDNNFTAIKVCSFIY